ncbi:MAG TPA: hypothetical protein VN025_01785 [Candidatus Dormibacteraeota bacterium]|jgi:hypothetical protein|nr:hypothetical protein [Candidatus Dormibacteraeota bacterium]
MSRTFAARLLCPDCDASSWLTLANREESFEQILRQPWDFKCREHGPQKGTPVELLEVAPLDAPAPSTPKSASRPAIAESAPKKRPRSGPRLAVHVPIVVYGFGSSNGSFQEETETVLVNAGGALVLLKARLSVGDTVTLIDKITGTEKQVRVAYVDKYTERESRVGLAFQQPLPGFWRRARKKPRVPKSLRVVVKGKDSGGRDFKQTAFTVDVSQDGVRLDGVGMLATSGQTIEVRRLWRKANFRVVWVGQIGTAESNQVGLFALNSSKNIWNVKLPDTLDSQSNTPKRKK